MAKLSYNISITRNGHQVKIVQANLLWHISHMDKIVKKKNRKAYLKKLPFGYTF